MSDYRLNAFRIDDKPGSDTRHIVRSVLSFMAQSFELMQEENDVPFTDAMGGASFILLACIDALKENDPEGGTP